MVVKLRKWRGEELINLSEEALFEGLKAAGLELHGISRKKASVPNVGVSKKRVRDTSSQGGGKKGTKYTDYDHPSEPGESPRRRTGLGQKGIVWGHSRSRLQARVGFTRAVRYMTFHELGIRYGRAGLQQRPTIVPAYRDNEGRLFQLVKRVGQRVMSKGSRKS